MDTTAVGVPKGAARKGVLTAVGSDQFRSDQARHTTPDPTPDRPGIRIYAPLLHRASVALGQLIAGGELAAHEVTEWLVTASCGVGQSEREAHGTIASGLRMGAKRPRRLGS
ncbi:hypothetical protein [Streptomyces sp. NPDC088794]|uniref:hypothetical protein n=1 Tax=Streptomyces sp. NPDC088794 TaxID=3365902 RepID=UPI003814C443